MQVSEVISSVSRYDHRIDPICYRDSFSGDGKGCQNGLRDGCLDTRQENRPTGQQERYQLSIADIIHDDARLQVHPAVRTAVSGPVATSTTSPMSPEVPGNHEDNWSSGHSDAGRSDRSSSLEDVIPPSIWRVARPAALHPTKDSITVTSMSALPASTRPRRHSAMSYVGPSTDGIPPSIWGIAKQSSAHATKPTASKTRRRASISSIGPVSARRARGNISVRHDPAWQAAMAATGKKISVTMGLYLDGEITVNGQHAVTVLREPPCGRCRTSGRECRVVDKTRDKNLVSGSCSCCIRQRRKCAT